MILRLRLVRIEKLTIFPESLIRNGKVFPLNIPIVPEYIPLLGRDLRINDLVEADQSGIDIESGDGHCMVVVPE